ncbi:hypothetical protein [Marinobacter sp. F3R08]|uniref:hypothetical protein n=1 Tax=Marinobacter sp. F3R08 TaxID=2841559 RepID=UPI001C0A3B88|nr:hypothetical protein [Marinobacter sp. F3R08]MBU2955075.1 hypothetical protein [Marinobacter sp. F3R08]
MRVVFAIDATDKVAHISNLPGCIRWAQQRTKATGRPIKIVCCRGGEKNGRTIAEVTDEGVRLIKAGTLWSHGKLRYLHVER